MTIDLGYIPSLINIKCTNNSGVFCVFYSLDLCKTFYTSNITSERTYVTNAWKLSEEQIIMMPYDPSAWRGTVFEVYAIK